MKYIDYANSYLPGEIYRSGMREYTPQQRIDYKTAKSFKFKPDKKGASMMTFQELLNVSRDPTIMMKSELNKMPSGFLPSPYG
tara:strand:+ start:933 stop:1181 length:249 start_codon:yes stop_codon:yes gene_type:complete